MKKIIELTNRYIIIATPLLLFLFILSLYFMVTMNNVQVIKILFGLILAFLMFVAFAAGWGNMIKSAVDEKNYDEPYLIIKDFAPGVGEFFLPVLGMVVFALLIFSASLTFIYFTGMHFIGDSGVSAEALSKAMASSDALKSFLLTLNPGQIVKLNLWNMLIFSTLTLVYFIMIFYSPALFYESKNPFKAFWLSIKHLFGKKFILNAGIYLLIFCVNFLLSILSAVFAKNNILSFGISLANFYFICCAAIGIFYYYNKNFVNLHLGNSIDTYI